MTPQTPAIGATTGSPGSGGATTGTGAAANATSGTGGTTSSSGGAATTSHPVFTWPEANPDGGTAMLCKPGHYTGTYMCSVDYPPFVMGLELDGPVDLQLSEGQNGEFLTVGGGSLKSAAAGFYQLDAKIQGQLDCQTGAFTAQLVDGNISIPPFPPGGTFSGDMKGSYDANGMQMNGTWNLLGLDTFKGATCTGPWQITYQGP